jgi:hypothetical protein
MGRMMAGSGLNQTVKAPQAAQDERQSIETLDSGSCEPNCHQP